jgi:hypothetical protein
VVCLGKEKGVNVLSTLRDDIRPFRVYKQECFYASQNKQSQVLEMKCEPERNVTQSGLFCSFLKGIAIN